MARGTFQGVAEVVIPIEEVISEFSAWADEIIDAVATEAVSEIKRQASLNFISRTGNLYRSIKKKKSRRVKGMAIAGAFAPHAHLIERGHDLVLGKNGRVVKHIPARPFVRAAENSITARLPEIVDSVMSDKIVYIKR